MSIPGNKRRVAYINEMIESGHAKELVAEGENYHVEQLASIARDICSRPGVRVVLIAGPSSSGKTSTSHRLCLELLNQGKQPVALSLDNWYVDGTLTPLKEDGKKDYESVYAIDLKQLEEDIKALIAGKEIALPTFNFAEEKREYLGETLQLEEGTIMVIEGIHALTEIILINNGLFLDIITPNSNFHSLKHKLIFGIILPDFIQFMKFFLQLPAFPTLNENSHKEEYYNSHCHHPKNDDNSIRLIVRK